MYEKDPLAKSISLAQFRRPAKKDKKRARSAPANEPLSAKTHVADIAWGFNEDDPVLSTGKLSAAKAMTRVYPYFYVLENSIRELIDRVLTKELGKDWWHSTEAAGGLKGEVANRMKDDEKHSWHQRRGARPLDYLDLKELPKLVTRNESHFAPKYIPDHAWFRNFVMEVYKSRCVVCHMNPLDRGNTQALKVRFTQWQKLMKAKKDVLPG